MEETTLNSITSAEEKGRREGEKERRRSQVEGGKGVIYTLGRELAYASAVQNSSSESLIGSKEARMAGKGDVRITKEKSRGW